MRFFQTIVSGAAMIAAVAGLTIDKYPSSVQAGQTYTIAYTADNSSPCTILLREGPSTNLITVATLTTTTTGGTFQWTVPTNLNNANDYALQILQGSTNNYSGGITVSGGTGAASSSAASSASASASASASSAASASASMSSAMSRSASSAAASASATKSSNSTISSATLSRSATSAAATSSKASTTSSGGPPQNSNAAVSLVASPLAAIVGAFAAFAYLA